jgi:hypothetical protein
MYTNTSEEPVNLVSVLGNIALNRIKFLYFFCRLTEGRRWPQVKIFWFIEDEM